MTTRWILAPRPYSMRATSLGMRKSHRHSPRVSEVLGAAVGVSVTAWAHAASGTGPRGRRGEGAGMREAAALVGFAAGVLRGPFLSWTAGAVATPTLSRVGLATALAVAALAGAAATSALTVDGCGFTAMAALRVPASSSASRR